MSETFADNLINKLDELKNDTYILSTDKISLDTNIKKDTLPINLKSDIYGLDYSIGVGSTGKISIGEKVGDIDITIEDVNTLTPSEEDKNYIDLDLKNDKCSGGFSYNVNETSNLKLCKIYFTQPEGSNINELNLMYKNSEATIYMTIYEENNYSDTVINIIESRGDGDCMEYFFDGVTNDNTKVNVIVPTGGSKSSYYENVEIKIKLLDSEYEESLGSFTLMKSVDWWYEFHKIGVSDDYNYIDFSKANGCCIFGLYSQEYLICCENYKFAVTIYNSDGISFVIATNENGNYNSKLYEEIPYNYTTSDTKLHVSIDTTIDGDIIWIVYIINNTDKLEIKVMEDSKEVYEVKYISSINEYIVFLPEQATFTHNVNEVKKPYPALLFDFGDKVDKISGKNVINDEIAKISSILDNYTIYTISRFVKN